MKVITILIYFLVIQVFIHAQGEGSSGSNKDSIGITSDSSISIIWQKKIEPGFSLPLMISGEKIFIGTPNGTIFCFDLNGDSLWSCETGGTVASKPAAEDNIIAAGTAEGDLLTIDAASGEIIQEIGLGEPVTSDLIIIDISNNGTKSKGIILGTSKGNLYCYDLYTLELLWSNNSAEDSIEGRLLLLNNRIVFGSRDKFLYCIDAKTGTINWKWRNSKAKEAQEKIPGPYTITADEKNVYVTERQNNILAGIDLLLGTAAWHRKDFKVSNSIGIETRGKKLIIPGAAGNCYMLSAADGKLIKEIKMDSGSERTYTDPVEWNDNFLFGSSSGKVYLIDPRFSWKTIISLDNSIVSLKQIKGNLFTASCTDGRVILFQIK